jgi:hypothetical protein
MKTFLIFIGIFLISTFGFSQKVLSTEDRKLPENVITADVVKGEVKNGDTALYYNLNPITFLPPHVFASKREQKKYSTLVMNVKKVYPYSVIINKTFHEIDHALDSIKDKNEQQKYIKVKEKELTDKFEKDIREMSFAQGRILIKLVDRQTGFTSYQIIKQFKGSLSAMFWQSIARIFSTNLKYEYDAKGEDAWIEEIVLQIEAGTL